MRKFEEEIIQEVNLIREGFNNITDEKMLNRMRKYCFAPDMMLDFLQAITRWLNKHN